MNYTGTEITDVIVHDHFIELIIRENKIVELDHIVQDFEYFRKISPNQEFGLMLVAKPYSNITSEARKYGNENFDWARAVALVSPSLAHKILFNFTIRLWSKHVMKSFNDEHEAKTWLIQKCEELR